VGGDGRLVVLINFTDSTGHQNAYAYTLSGGARSVTALFDYTEQGVAPVIGDPVGYLRNATDQRSGIVFVDGQSQRPERAPSHRERPLHVGGRSRS
jgi:hypothetical protein